MTVKPIPEDWPQITAMVFYENVAAALDWLRRTFGFDEHGQRFSGPDGKVNHATMRYGTGFIMLGYPGPAYQNPKRLGHVTQSLYVYTEDVDAHFARAKSTGATILHEPKEEFYGDRRYGVADLEGHHWFFAQRVREGAPEEH